MYFISKKIFTKLNYFFFQSTRPPREIKATDPTKSDRVKHSDRKRMLICVGKVVVVKKAIDLFIT